MPRPSDQGPERLALPAMGTRLELVIAGAEAPRERWRCIGESALAAVGEWHGRLNRFDASSWARWAVRQPAGTPLPLDGDLLDLLGLCERVREGSGGAFDIAGGAGDALELDADAATLTIDRAGLILDFGAVAKGFALDLVLERLVGEGVTSAIVHGGTSTAMAIGTSPTGEPWRVSVGEGPGAPVVELVDAALSVSGNGAGAPRPGHIADYRRVGVRSGGMLAMAAAVGASAAATDAWSTALLVLGERPATMDDSITSLLPELSGGGGWRVQGPHANSISTTRAVVCCP